MPHLASIAKIIAMVALLVIIDQSIKAWVVTNMAYGEEWPLLPCILHSDHVFDKGALWCSQGLTHGFHM